jgi:hypothetical protein
MILNKTEAQDLIDCIESRLDDIELSGKSNHRQQILRLQDLYMSLTKFILTGEEYV